MTEDRKNRQKNDAQPGDIARRDFVPLSVATGLAATAGPAAAAGRDVAETST
jgi:hypothetical protein